MNWPPTIAAAGTHDPLLSARLQGQRRQIERVTGGLAWQSYVVPWLAEPPVGVAALTQLLSR